MNASATEEEALGTLLLARARAALRRALCADPAPLPDGEALAGRGATFVTLHRQGRLRGCIGSLRPQRSLAEDVAANAVAAATRDPRFAPLQCDELDSVDIEVSLLSPAEFIDFADEDALLRQLRPHTDGLMLFAGCRSATFLPQVWDELPAPADFLAALRNKAGLPPGRSVDGLMAARYTVRKWHEERP
ncbi:AmmeMemoRadiSam system protein A [Pseudothauera lacus]|uniref:AmmeMemoRadiSam system protein A n=1 Tax=Pseudothauera lacus TaxID=2136175 RepID=A0A2T4IJP5_9RHOO|nr:AmmeMemoRadiSam system protein A [Pseudothauera lacus]PTD97966.1 AmmeMemoRadiSam system protein A [Pseudothauera lacus]